jgi:hypothetical protein
LSNPTFKDVVKIGKTTKDVDYRAAQLHSTGSPTPFEIELALHVPDCHKLEKKIHIALSDYRVDNGREFFALSVEDAIEQVVSNAGVEFSNRDLFEIVYAVELESLVARRATEAKYARFKWVGAGFALGIVVALFVVQNIDAFSNQIAKILFDSNLSIVEVVKQIKKPVEEKPQLKKSKLPPPTGVSITYNDPANDSEWRVQCQNGKFTIAASPPVDLVFEIWWYDSSKIDNLLVGSHDATSQNTIQYEDGSEHIFNDISIEKLKGLSGFRVRYRDIDGIYQNVKIWVSFTNIGATFDDFSKACSSE